MHHDMTLPTILIVPGLRDHVPDHWQTHLELALRQSGRKVVAVAPMGRTDLNCQARVQAIDAAVQGIDGPLVLVAHSGGCIMVAHWAATSVLAGRVSAALLAAPPDFEQPMPEGYPSMADLHAAGWFPVPRDPLPFPSVVLLSRNDPLGAFDRVSELAGAWGASTVDLGDVGHLNPASGFGRWPDAMTHIQRLDRMAQAANRNPQGA